MARTTARLRGDDRLAGAALGREHGDDLAERRRRTRSTVAGGDRRRRWAPIERRRRRGGPPRRAATVSTGAASTSLTPARSACWKQLGGELVGDEDGADLGVRGEQRARRRPSPAAAAHDGPRTTTTGRAAEALGERLERVEGVAGTCSPSCMARRLRVGLVGVDDGHRRSGADVEVAGGPWSSASARSSSLDCQVGLGRRGSSRRPLSRRRRRRARRG